VLLHGPAGVGKTALAAALASGYAELPGGVLWLEVNNDTFPALLNRVARAYGAAGDDWSGQRDSVQQLLRENRPLVVLDGQVQIDAAREFVRECAGGVPLLLTQVKMFPGPWTPYAVKPLSAEDTASLLSHLAGTPIQPAAPDTAQLLDILAGMPLAITLAGHQLADGRTAAQFMAQLPDLPPGQTNRIMAVTTAAYRLLAPELQGMAVLLATAFAGGASEELLATTSRAPGAGITARMRQLVGRGFASERTVYDQPYFVVHEIVQSFAEAFLRGKQRLNTMVERHMQGLQTYLQQHANQDDPDHYQRLAAEIESMMAAGRYAAENGQTDFLTKLVQGLEPASPQSFVTACGFQFELDRLTALLRGPEPVPAPVEALPEESAEALPLAETPAQEKPVSAPEAGIAPVEKTDTEPTQPALTFDAIDKKPLTWAETAALELTPTEPMIPESQGEAESLTGIEHPGNIAAPEAEAMAGFQANGSIEDELAALSTLAAQNLGNQNYDDVLNYVERGMALAQESGNPEREGELLGLLGDLQITLGDLDGAETAYREAVVAFRSSESWPNIGLTLDKLGSLYWELGRYEDAIDTWQQALTVFQRIEDTDMVRAVLDKIGDTQTDLGEWDSAQASYTQALALAKAADDQPGVFEQYRQIGWVLELRGDTAGAILHYRRALHLAFSLSDGEKQSRIMLSLAHLMIDDTNSLNLALQLLQTASTLQPDNTEAQRLLSRVKTRQERLLRAGVTLALGPESLQDYAQTAFELNV
jgi:tetratricopeptide (TPR) repeat protein